MGSSKSKASINDSQTLQKINDECYLEKSSAVNNLLLELKSTLNKGEHYKESYSGTQYGNGYILDYQIDVKATQSNRFLYSAKIVLKITLNNGASETQTFKFGQEDQSVFNRILQWIKKVLRF